MPRESKKSIYAKTVLLGTVGGLLLWFCIVLLDFLQFVEYGPNVFLFMFPFGDWVYDWRGSWISAIFIVSVSILVTFLYFALFRKISTMWIGILYGLALYAVIFFFYFPMLEDSLSWNRTLENDVDLGCLFVMYGLFIGYSIAYEWNESDKRSVQRI
ncbi:MAG: YqhR family membrane protein [Bacilli bacterium]